MALATRTSGFLDILLPVSPSFIAVESEHLPSLIAVPDVSESPDFASASSGADCDRVLLDVARKRGADCGQEDASQNAGNRR
jgi:hypothetical protein